MQNAWFGHHALLRHHTWLGHHASCSLRFALSLSFEPQHCDDCVGALVMIVLSASGLVVEVLVVAVSVVVLWSVVAVAVLWHGVAVAPSVEWV